jgi:glycerol kinase
MSPNTTSSTLGDAMPGAISWSIGSLAFGLDAPRLFVINALSVLALSFALLPIVAIKSSIPAVLYVGLLIVTHIFVLAIYLYRLRFRDLDPNLRSPEHRLAPTAFRAAHRHLCGDTHLARRLPPTRASHPPLLCHHPSSKQPPTGGTPVDQLLTIDQGTTSSRAIRFDLSGTQLAVAQRELTQYYPRPGWVEHDPEEIWQTTVEVAREALAVADFVAAIGITNQRETTLIWDRTTGEPIHPAIVWQDRRTAEHCAHLKADGAEPLVRERTGLLLDPYFSGTKIAWLLDHIDGARARAEAGQLAFGTIDTFLIWRLTDGRLHATDATNAARTLLFNIHTQDWDEDLLKLLDVPRALLPEVHDCAAEFGTTDANILGSAIAIRGVAGDQHAATIGQACLQPDMVKSTYGTGCFAVLNTGNHAVQSNNGLLTTLAYRLNGKPTYALEGSIFVAGSAVQWLRDELRIIDSAAETEALASSLDDNGGVYLVPAFVGLGAPHWNPNARGAVVGLTRNSGAAHFVRAALEAVAYQTHDLAVAMADDAGSPIATLRVDGGMVANNWLTQFLADILGVPVERPTVTETTALGGAYLAALQSGLLDSIEDLGTRWQLDRRFEPAMDPSRRAALLDGWQRAIGRVVETSNG